MVSLVVHTLANPNSNVGMIFPSELPYKSVHTSVSEVGREAPPGNEVVWSILLTEVKGRLPTLRGHSRYVLELISGLKKKTTFGISMVVNCVK